MGIARSILCRFKPESQQVLFPHFFLASVAVCLYFLVMKHLLSR